jgi:hypothetical protein
LRVVARRKHVKGDCAMHMEEEESTSLRVDARSLHNLRDCARRVEGL